jgi:hypothetical protein
MTASWNRLRAGQGPPALALARRRRLRSAGLVWTIPAIFCSIMATTAAAQRDKKFMELYGEKLGGGVA